MTSNIDVETKNIYNPNNDIIQKAINQKDHHISLLWP